MNIYSIVSHNYSLVSDIYCLMLKETIGGGAVGRGWLKEYFLSGISFSSTLGLSDAMLFERQLFQLSFELDEVVGLKLVGLRLDDLVMVGDCDWSSDGLEICCKDILASSLCVSCGVSVIGAGDGLEASGTSVHWSGGGLGLVMFEDAKYDCFGDDVLLLLSQFSSFG